MIDPPTSASSPSRQPVVVFACRVFQNWLEQLLPEGLVREITFFDYALHSVPRKLQHTLQSALESLEQPSLVVLGYGLCGNGTDGLQAGRHILLIPRTDDCIAIILGSYQAYRQEFDRVPATYYLSQGWLEGGSSPLDDYRKYVEKYGEKKSDWLMDLQYHNYKRLALIAQNERDLEKYRPAALEVAHFCERWGLRYEEIVGSQDLLVHLIQIAAGLEQAGQEFLVVPPGGSLQQSQFIRLQP